MAVKVSPYNWDRVGRNRDRKDLQAETNRRVHADPIAQAATEATGEDNSEVSGEDNAGKPGYDAYGNDVSDSGIPGVNRTEGETRRIWEEAFSGVDWDSPGTSSSPAPVSGGRIGGVDWGAAGPQKSGQGGFEDWSNALYKFMSDYFGPSRKDEGSARAAFEQTFGGSHPDEFKEDWRRRPQRESVYADDKGGVSSFAEDVQAYRNEHPPLTLTGTMNKAWDPSYRVPTAYSVEPISDRWHNLIYGRSEHAVYRSAARKAATLQRNLALTDDFIAGKLTGDEYQKSIKAVVDDSSLQVPDGRIDPKAYGELKDSIPGFQERFDEAQKTPAFRLRALLEGIDNGDGEAVRKLFTDNDETWRAVLDQTLLSVPEERRDAVIDRLVTAALKEKNAPESRRARYKQAFLQVYRSNDDLGGSSAAAKISDRALKRPE